MILPAGGLCKQYRYHNTGIPVVQVVQYAQILGAKFVQVVHSLYMGDVIELYLSGGGSLIYPTWR